MNLYGLILAKQLSGGGGSSTLVPKTITANGTYNPADDNADGYSSVTANVPNTYTLADEGKVVDSGALVSQTAKSIDANGLYDTTLNNSVDVSVANSYSAGDEGKVVSSGTLVSQTAYPSTIVANGTYDTTLNNNVTVNVTDPNFSPLEALLAGSLNVYSTETPLSYPTTIGAYALANCWGLEEVTLNNATVGEQAFSNCPNLKKITLSGNTSLGLRAFYNCPMLHDVTIPSTVTVTDYLFASSGVYSATVYSAGRYMFQNCLNLHHAVIYTHVYQQMFDGCADLEYVTLSGNISSIGQAAFSNCQSLLYIDLTGVTSIAINAFQYCTALTSINIPSTITHIGNNAFVGCTALTSITIDKSEGSISGAPWGAPNATVTWTG